MDAQDMGGTCRAFVALFADSTKEKGGIHNAWTKILSGFRLVCGLGPDFGCIRISTVVELARLIAAGIACAE